MKIDDEIWLAYCEPYFQFQAQYDRAQFAVITAWNPGSKPLSDKDNNQRNLNLFEDLAHCYSQKVWVGNQDFSWKEESFAVAITKELAVRLGKKYQQNAVYFVEKDRLFLLSCLNDATELELGSLRSRCLKGIQI